MKSRSGTARIIKRNMRKCVKHYQGSSFSKINLKIFVHVCNFVIAASLVLMEYSAYLVHRVVISSRVAKQLG